MGGCERDRFGRECCGRDSHCPEPDCRVFPLPFWKIEERVNLQHRGARHLRQAWPIDGPYRFPLTGRVEPAPTAVDVFPASAETEPSRRPDAPRLGEVSPVRPEQAAFILRVIAERNVPQTRGFTLDVLA